MVYLREILKHNRTKLIQYKNIELAAYLYVQSFEELPNHSFELSLEQQFNIRSFESQVAHMSLEQAQQFLVELYRQMIVKETMYKEFLKHEWGLGERFQAP